MAALLPWVERKFSFEFDVRTYPDVVERFRGTPARIDERARGLSREVLTKSDGGWSIQENVGHLVDLEPLWDGRLADFLDGKTILRAADITNQATVRAGHNSKDIAELTRAFRFHRERQAARLDGLSLAEFSRVAEHPRLKVPMRLVDAVAFVCAHDDYHLARISELKRRFGVSRPMGTRPQSG
jgi:uncharacterized damage-inducible protein DinB